MAVDLELTSGAYSKIENGAVKITVERLVEIATVLDVNIIEFFPKPKTGSKMEDNQKNYGYANKTDVDELIFLIRQLKQEIASLKKEIAMLTASKIKRK